MALLPIIVFSQEKKTVYCFIELTTNANRKVFVTVDAGEEIIKGDIVDEENKPRPFDSRGAALNFMASNGWEVVLLSNGLSDEYLLKKEVKNTEEAKEGLRIKEKKEKKQ